jgi:hypothetical protein
MPKICKLGKNSSKHKQSETGLPDGIVSNQKSHFGEILEGLVMENVVHPIGNFYGHFGTF